MDWCGSVKNIFLWCWGNGKKGKNQYSDFLMSLDWLVWVVDENLITHCGWWMCGWPVAMHRAQLHWSVHCLIDRLPGSCCEASGLTNKAQRKELLNINPGICFQGAGSWRGQWAEGLHVDLHHRLPPGGSLLWLSFCLRWRAGGACGEDAGWQQIGYWETQKGCRMWPLEVCDLIWSRLSGGICTMRRAQWSQSEWQWRVVLGQSCQRGRFFYHRNEQIVYVHLHNLVTLGFL